MLMTVVTSRCSSCHLTACTTTCLLSPHLFTPLSAACPRSTLYTTSFDIDALGYLVLPRCRTATRHRVPIHLYPSPATSFTTAAIPAYRLHAPSLQPAFAHAKSTLRSARIGCNNVRISMPWMDVALNAYTTHTAHMPAFTPPHFAEH